MAKHCGEQIFDTSRFPKSSRMVLREALRRRRSLCLLTWAMPQYQHHLVTPSVQAVSLSSQSNPHGPTTDRANRMPQTVDILGKSYATDEWTNVTPRIISKVGVNLHNCQYHPVNLIRQRIVNYFYKTFFNHVGNPLFAVFDSISPVVTVQQNFDSLLVPPKHVSRSRSDTYYINKNELLRAHTSAHQDELIRMGFDAFLAVGDVYRRDEIDRSHYPVFHQMEAVRLMTKEQVFSNVSGGETLELFEKTRRAPEKQEVHTLEAVKLLEHDLKTALTGLAHTLFGKDINCRWVGCYFPFTHPSWELEVEFHGQWLEVLGCGIMEQKMLHNAGAGHKIGWAFGLGLERLAMKLYNIPDIRLFWSEDPGFAIQFKVKDPATPITYKAVSQFPPCVNDMAFWIPETFTPNDFYDLVRSEGGDVIEQVTLIDEFLHPKHARTSHCYRIVYRHMDKTFTQEEVNLIHFKIADLAAQKLGVELRVEK